MNQDLYLKHYRLRAEGDARPASVAESGSASTFRAVDIRSGAPVSLTLIPVGAIPDEQRAKFEANARSIVQFDHAHIARTVDFGQEGDEYAFVSECPRGETTERWVAQHGRLSPEAVLRIALQVVSAIGAAAYHQIVHADIRPANLVITPGQTAEGGWPSIKLTNLATGGVGASASTGVVATQFASPEQLREGTVDLRSEIYSLGATMCFLLTGAFYSAEPRSLQTRRFARPLRKLIQPMLRQNPADRPQDPVVLAEAIGTCLAKVERRESLARRSGIPFLAVRTPPARAKAPRPPQALPKQILAPIGLPLAAAEARGPFPSRRRWSPVFAIAAAVLLGLGIIGAAVIPARHMFFSRTNGGPSAEVGVPIGVAQPAPVWEGKPLVMNKDRIPASVAPASAAPSAAPSTAAIAAEQPALAQTDQSEPPAPGEGPQSVWEKAGNRSLSERIVNKNGVASVDRAEIADKAEAAESPQESQPEARGKIASAADDRNDDSVAAPPKASGNSENVRARIRPNASANVHRTTTRTMTGRASTARIAPDGSVVLRFANGETFVLPPPHDEYPLQRRYHRPRRTIIERRTVVVPGPPPGLEFLPPD